MRRVWAGVVVAVALGLGGCSREPRHAYPPDVVENFVAACRTRAEERACRCAIDRLRDTFPYEQYRALDARMGTGELPPEVGNAVSECARR